MTEKKKVNNNVKSHDRFFKKSMSYPEIAYEFFKSYLPKAGLLTKDNKSATINTVYRIL